MVRKQEGGMLCVLLSITSKSFSLFLFWWVGRHSSHQEAGFCNEMSPWNTASFKSINPGMRVVRRNMDCIYRVIFHFRTSDSFKALKGARLQSYGQIIQNTGTVWAATREISPFSPSKAEEGPFNGLQKELAMLQEQWVEIIQLLQMGASSSNLSTASTHHPGLHLIYE